MHHNHQGSVQLISAVWFYFRVVLGEYAHLVLSLFTCTWAHYLNLPPAHRNRSTISTDLVWSSASFRADIAPFVSSFFTPFDISSKWISFLWPCTFKKETNFFYRLFWLAFRIFLGTKLIVLIFDSPKPVSVRFKNKKQCLNYTSKSYLTLINNLL